MKSSMYKINYYQDDYYDDGRGKWITVYKSKTPLSQEEILELCKEYIRKQLRESEGEDVIKTLRYEDVEQTSEGVYFVACTGDPDNPSLSDYEWEAEFEYEEPEEETSGWC